MKDEEVGVQSLLRRVIALLQPQSVHTNDRRFTKGDQQPCHDSERVPGTQPPIGSPPPQTLHPLAGYICFVFNCGSEVLALQTGHSGVHF